MQPTLVAKCVVYGICMYKITENMFQIILFITSIKDIYISVYHAGNEFFSPSMEKRKMTTVTCLEKVITLG